MRRSEAPPCRRRTISWRISSFMRLRPGVAAGHRSSTRLATLRASRARRAKLGGQQPAIVALQLGQSGMALPVLQAAQQIEQHAQLPGQPVPRRAQTRIAHRAGHAVGLQQGRPRVVQHELLPAPARPRAADRSRPAPRPSSATRAAPSPRPRPGCPWATASTAAPGPATTSPNANRPAPRRSAAPAAPVAGTPNSCAGPAGAPLPPASARPHAPAPARSTLPPIRSADARRC